MADRLTLEIVTPEKQVLDVETPWVTLPGVVGELGILPNHVPVVTSIESGVLKWDENGREVRAAIHYGYAQVENDRVTVLANMVERGDEIDLDRAREAEQGAHRELRRLIDEETDSEPRIDKYEAKLRRAVARMSASD